MLSLSSGVLGGRYVLEERIGTGGFSEVWRGRDTLLDRPVAVKLLHAGYAQHAETLARFRAEARHAGGLAHENIARVFDYCEPDPPYPPVLVMELVDGPSLADVLARGALDEARSMDVVAQTAAGLDAAHRAGLVHRDIKPGNLLLGPGGVVKITDFGISHAVGSAPVTSTGMIIGTPGYLAPERAAGARATAASDLYALGVVAYECLAGAAPFAGIGLEVALAHRDRSLPALPASVPAEVAALVRQLTAKDPARRPRSAGEVAGRAGQLRDGMLDSADLPVQGAADIPAAYAGWAPTLGRSLPPAPRRSPRAARGGRRAALAPAAVVAAAAGLVLSGMAGPVASPAPAPVPRSSASGPRSSAVVMVDINSSSLVGQPVATVVRRLRGEGLAVRVLWQHTGRQPPGRAVSVQPAGPLPRGSRVTVTGALQPAHSPGQPNGASTSHGKDKGKGKGKGHGNDNGQGDGNGNGHGKGKGNGKGNG